MLSFIFELLYGPLAWAYDPVSWLVSGGRWREWQRAALAQIVGWRVLEVGCGPGHLLLDLLRAGYLAVGVERSPAMWRRAAARLARAGRPGRVVGADARELPFADASVDTLIYTFPTPVIRETAFWDEATRVVRPGGRIVVVEAAVSNTRLWPGLIERLWGIFAGRGAEIQEPTTEAVGLLLGPDVSRHLVAHRLVQRTPRGTVWLIVAEVISSA